VDVALVIRRRLKELGLEQRDLAAAAQVTESYVSQLLARKKAPPSPGRTDIYERMGRFLKLSGGELARLAELQRREELKKKVADPPAPLFEAFRELTLRKCDNRKREPMRRIFEKEPFGELERLVTQRLLDVCKGVVKEELESENWLRLVARLSGRSYEQMRVVALEFLDTDVFHVSLEDCVGFLDPLIESWDIDLETFAVEVALNRRLTLERVKRFEFTQSEPPRPVEAEPGLDEFLADPSLSGDATGQEVAFLRSLRLPGRRPTPLYYYRELQNLRDPLHFRATAGNQETAPQPGAKPRSPAGKARTTARTRGANARETKQPARSGAADGALI
jgi:transcriptional regulator with XRE-family HTH domain